MNEYQIKLKSKMDEYAHFIYRVTKQFPREERYGIIPQVRRSALSVVLNYVEGYARRKPLVRLNFLEISFGSLKESKYLLHFSFVEDYIKENKYEAGLKLAEEICKLEKSTKK